MEAENAHERDKKRSVVEEVKQVEKRRCSEASLDGAGQAERSPEQSEEAFFYERLLRILCTEKQEGAKAEKAPCNRRQEARGNEHSTEHGSAVNVAGSTATYTIGRIAAVSSAATCGGWKLDRGWCG